MVLLISALAGWFLLPALGSKLHRSIGEPVADFPLPIIIGGDNGSRQSLLALRGKVVLLDFGLPGADPAVRAFRLSSGWLESKPRTTSLSLGSIKVNRLNKSNSFTRVMTPGTQYCRMLTVRSVDSSASAACQHWS